MFIKLYGPPIEECKPDSYVRSANDTQKNSQRWLLALARTDIESAEASPLDIVCVKRESAYVG
uniref:Uncharacterized protein n=1 Tax=Timema monikensis TaxID=170555 RepID=A0A7R9EGA4_9NEOP|nr:unnamed protein product [Timema monikensis]